MWRILNTFEISPVVSIIYMILAWLLCIVERGREYIMSFSIVISNEGTGNNAQK